MHGKLSKLRAAKIAHPSHNYSKEQEKLIESLSEEEVRMLIDIKKKLSQTNLVSDLKEGGAHPDTLVL